MREGPGRLGRHGARRLSDDGPILTARLRLDPLVVADATEMAAVLDDQALYQFTGGEPPSLPDLERRYEAQAAGRSPDGTETWRNWIVRLLEDGAAVGFVQATLTDDDRVADVAWLIGAPWQGRGYATEAARAMLLHLLADGVETASAHVHPDHAASGRVAAATGLSPTDEIEDGERVWRHDAGLRPEGRRSDASSGGARAARRRG